MLWSHSRKPNPLLPFRQFLRAPSCSDSRFLRFGRLRSHRNVVNPQPAERNMALYSNLRDYQFGDATENDIRGARGLSVNDEKLGEISDGIFDTKSGEGR